MSITMLAGFIFLGALAATGWLAYALSQSQLSALRGENKILTELATMLTELLDRLAGDDPDASLLTSGKPAWEAFSEIENHE